MVSLIFVRVRRFILNKVDHEIFCRERVNDAEMETFIASITAHSPNMAHQFGFSAVPVAEHSKSI